MFKSALILLCIISTNVHAVYNGVFEEDLPPPEKHTYAGFLFFDAALIGLITEEQKFVTCGVTLVDGPQIPLHLKRRVLVTAGHCAESDIPGVQVDQVFVAFNEDPEMIIGNEPPLRFPIGFNNASPVFAGKPYSPFATQASGLGSGTTKLDYGVIILDQQVPIAVVPRLARLPAINQAKGVKSVIMTGYGINVWGNQHSVKLEDAPATGSGEVLGERKKMTITMDVLSLNATNMNTAMNFQHDQTSCNGDSGSGEIIDATPKVIVAVTSAGDFNCRALQTNTRIDTQPFFDFLAEVISQN